MTEQEMIHWALEKINQAIDDKMYGALTFKFENGRLVSSKIEMTDKPLVKQNKNV